MKRKPSNYFIGLGKDMRGFEPPLLAHHSTLMEGGCATWPRGYWPLIQTLPLFFKEKLMHINIDIL